ncbi:MAG: BON domain-containing protein [Thermoanaerobaculia bacterium]|nr:BON domain-containing protein [Thermoanaerobaculia bacterium]
MKTFLIVTSMIVALAAAFLYAASRSDNEMIAVATEDVRDTSASLLIKTELIRHFGTDAKGIRVRATDNAVSLSGRVAERSTQELAEEVVRAIDGVDVVHNFIDLESGALNTPAELLSNAELEARDALLETGVKTRLTSDIGDEAFAISVEACDGVVSLRGELPDDERREVAIRATREVPGVTRVIDLLEIAA